MDQININKGLMNPQNKPIKKTNYLTKECKGLMDPKSFKKKEKKENQAMRPFQDYQKMPVINFVQQQIFDEKYDVYKVVDIDTKEDWKKAELMYKVLNKR